MGFEKYLLLFANLVSFLYFGDGCQMDGVANWFLTQDAEILDTFRGTFWNRQTNSIAGITGVIVGGNVNYAPYLSVQLDGNGAFTISTTDGYAQYEENETSEFISFSVNFQCTDASTNSLIFSIRVIDTNNNAPIFRPTDQYEFTITPPLPPGFQITGCVGDDIVVRDIDLTTSRIDFTIEDNEYFEIIYDGRSSADPKEFLASLKTKNLIRSLPESVELTISATDVDATGDPPITTVATIRVAADEAFLFPEELVFSQPYYTATYSNNQLELEQVISLQQGFDDEVTFLLEGENSNYFELLRTGNEITIGVAAPLTNEILRSGRIILVVRAEREYTSGATTTVVVQLPEVLGLEFSQIQYDGRIVDNVLEPMQLSLNQGYEDGFQINILNDYSSYFSVLIQNNVITLSMTPLSDQIINENNFITLQVVASNQYSTATAVVTLDVIKDDNVTPVFEKPFYNAQYNPDTGLTVEQIALQQGYDETVEFSFEGDYSEYFSLTNAGPIVTLSTSNIPNDIWIEQQLVLTIQAAKPRSVVGTTVVSVSLPPARELSFEAPTYRGVLQDNSLNLEIIVLNEGYNDDINFTLSGDYATYFILSSNQNEVTVSLSTAAALPDDVILQNSFLTLTVSAAGLHAVPTATTILIEIVKQDLNTPVFSENVYTGSYGVNSIEIGNISLIQGYDNTVVFRLDGEHSQYFEVTYTGSNVNLNLVSQVPAEVIFRDKVLTFSILAEKPLTVGANAAISISFPQELTDATVLKFSQNTYVGSVQDTLSLENIILDSGYETGTIFSLKGDHASEFVLQNIENVITISMPNSLPEDIIENNEFIILEVEASRERAVSASASIVIDIIKETIIPPSFSNAYYKSVYADEVLNELTITLAEGYDDTVTFELEGESSVWFLISNVANNIFLTLNVSNTIPDEILENNDYFLFSIVANKPNTNTAKAAVFVHLPKETPETVVVRFSQTSYVGRIENGLMYAPAITLLGEREPISFNITGDYAQYFEVNQISPTDVQLNLRNSFLPENLDEISFIILDIEAQYPEAISGHTAIILEIVKEPIITPVFEHAYYTGEYSREEGLLFDLPIRLIQGFDESVVFTLAGDDAQWFELNNVDENSLTLILNTGLEEIRDRSHLAFSVMATKTGSVSGQTAVIITLSARLLVPTGIINTNSISSMYSILAFPDLITTVSLGFERNFYLGSIEKGTMNITNINLQEGYTPDMNSTFSGDHAEYFQLNPIEEGVFTLQLLFELPTDVIDNNNFLVFTLEVQVDNARAHTTIILELIKDVVTPLAFEESFYVGSYSTIGGFTFDHQITLSGVYDETVLFSLEGDDSQWFQIVENQYPLQLTQTIPIPNEIISNTHQLIFVILAEKVGNSTARATIIITIVDDTTVLEFERNVYIGTIENDLSTLTDSITLIEDYSQNVTFTLFGELQSYFSISQVGESIMVSLQTAIPDELIPRNGIIQLDLQVSAPDAISGYTSLVFGIVREENALHFSEMHYSGSYSQSGLDFPDNITLVEGFNENVIFVLEGDDAQYFEAEVVSENLVSLRLRSQIPTELIVNRQPLIFTIRADRPNAITARATIIIELIDTVLRFSQNNYLGSIENNTAILDPISLREGYSQNVSFSLIGDFNSYFRLSRIESTVSIILDLEIPDNLIPNNRIIVLELQASDPNANPAYSTIIFHVEREQSMTENLIFDNAFYTGKYSEGEGFIFNNNITFVEGYDENVQFILEGDDSQYFEVVRTDNSISIGLINPIPAAVLANYHHLIFTLRAEKPNANAAIVTIVISLLDDIPDPTILRFNKTSYLATLENSTFNLLEPITLSEVYNQNITFELIGDLKTYFTISVIEDVIVITLQNPIPEDEIPDNNIIILELQASATQAISAYTIVIVDVVQHDAPVLEQIIFSEAYYTGHYTEVDSLIFTNPITVIEGYNDNVTFILEGDSSQYFEVVIEAKNSVSIRLTTPIPSPVVLNNHHLIFTIRAERPDAWTGRATIVIALLDEYVDDTRIIGFDRITYVGSLENNVLNLDPLTLSEGYSEAVTFRLHGDFESFFTVSQEESRVTINLVTSIPEQLMPNNKIIILELEAVAPDSKSAQAGIVIEIIQDPTIARLVFSSAFYRGHYTEVNGFVFEETITLTEGYDSNVTFTLEGDHSEYFEAVVTDNSVLLVLRTPLPSAVVMNNHQLIFIIDAEKPDALSATATIVISLLDEYNEDLELLGFDRISYIGSIENDNIDLQPIILSEGYSEDVTFRLYGDLASYFRLNVEETTISLGFENLIPDQNIPDNRLIVLEIEASAPESMSARATIVLKVVQEENSPVLEQLIFSQVYYTGHYTELSGLIFEETITLTEGYDTNVTFILEGDASENFVLEELSQNFISLRLINPIPSAVVTNNHQLILTIQASKPEANPAQAVIVISLKDDYCETTPTLGFNRINYIGSIQGSTSNIETIILSEGYSANVEFTLHGELQNYFTLTVDGPYIIIDLSSNIPEELTPANNIVVLYIQAAAPDTIAAQASIVFKVIQEKIVFSEPYYTGEYSIDGGLMFNTIMTLSQGYTPNVQFFLEGEHSQWFQLADTENSVTLSLAIPIPEDILETNRKLIFIIVAKNSDSSTTATIIISLPEGAVSPDVTFEKILFEGVLQGGEVHHETIELSGYDETSIQIFGEYAALFSASFSDGEVTIHGVGSVTLPASVSFVALELRAGVASSVLLLDVDHTENPVLPTVTFSSSSYVLHVEDIQTGLVGRVQATADNGEAVIYALAVDSEHLLQRISISQEGELHLSAAVSAGEYSFQATATTAFTRASAAAMVYLTVEAITEENDYVLPPLQILDRDEESPHERLVSFNATFEGCNYRLDNRWPLDQSWLYVDENGLHTTAIDREHASIAFMALSQIQVELVLECNSDNTASRKKRVLDSESRTTQLEHLGPYDYGNSKWILTDSIDHSPRRSLVNLIVNDINDNDPIFIGKENEPIVVGYPLAELEERILPRALAEVKANDADVGENAALVYWSTEESLAVSPTSGSVHVRNIGQIENNTILTVYATDRLGQGRTGSLDLMVKLIDTNHIAIVTVKGAFLDDEIYILANLSAAVGYEVKALRSTVISDTESDEIINSRNKREATISSGGSLQLFVYGLIGREPVNVFRLAEDINNNVIETVIIASTVSLEDHLESLEICPVPGRDTALLVSTIILAVLLFILIAAAAVWFFLKWRKAKSYEEFSDEDSLASKTESKLTESLPKLEQPKARINIEDLKRSEKRLQERLEAPVEIDPLPARTPPKPVESKVNIPDLPLVIQSIDKLKDADESEDEDEFGERMKNRRKSVVTFNENVEKIIHVEDPPDADDSDIEVYKL